MRVRRALATFCLLVATPIVFGQSPETAKSTGQEGQLLPGIFPSFNVNGAHAKNLFCLFCEHDLNPTVAIIAFKLPEKPTEPFASLLQKLETRVVENKAAHFGGFAIFLTLEKPLIQDRTGGAAVGAAEGLIKDLKLKEVTIGLEHRDTPHLATFGIDKEKPESSEITVLVYNKHKVEKRFTFTSTKKMTDNDVNEIVAAIDKILPARKPN